VRAEQERGNLLQQGHLQSRLIQKAFCISAELLSYARGCVLFTTLAVQCFNLTKSVKQLMAMGIANVMADGMSMGFGGEFVSKPIFTHGPLSGSNTLVLSISLEFKHFRVFTSADPL